MRLTAREPDDLCTSAIAWEETPCPLCGSERYAPGFEAADCVRGLRFLIVQCRHCGLCFTNPRPDEDSIERFYPDDYRCHQTRPERTKDRWWRSDPMRTLLPIRGGARLLDFGCGGGDFLTRMAGLGWNVVGLDAFGEPGRLGSLPQPTWADGFFDAITMWQSLEHVHRPLEVLRDAHRLLAPGGTLLVSVPNLESWASRWFSANWYGLDVPRHLTHFTAETLHQMLQRAGFGAIEIRQQKRAGWIRHSARRADSRWLQTRLGSETAGWWGRLIGRGDSLLAIVRKEPSTPSLQNFQDDIRKAS